MTEINPWKTISSEIVYSNNWIDIKHEKVINPAGNEGIYGMAHFKNVAAAIIPLDTDLNTYLVGQFRYPLKEYSWEIPMGGSPIGKSVLDGAKRELKEETGLIAHNWLEIGKVHTSNCVTDEVGIMYLAENLEQEMATSEETELLVLKKIPLKKALEMVMDGEITDSISMIAILKVARLKNI